MQIIFINIFTSFSINYPLVLLYKKLNKFYIIKIFIVVI
ncbi:hypothetical protein QEA_3892 [Clostridioides difficile CD109]|nr:hypothetical protein QEA_3892 [Clostridioides difficile CD109]EQI92173.1 hypothetical protein QQM_4039 [Clostridioides difficile P2]